MRRKIVGFSLLTFLAFVAHAMLNTQAIPYLTEVGYTPVERGYIMAFYATIAMVGQFVIGFLCDKHKTIKRFLILMTIFLIGFSFLTYTLHDKNFIMHFFLMGSTISLVRIIGNLLEIWLIEVDGLYSYFGVVRSFGSLGWALSSLGTGYLIVQYGYGTMAYVASFINILVIFLSIALEDADKTESKPIKFADIKLLFQNKSYILLLVVYTFAFIVYNADSTSVTDYILSIGGTEGDVGMKWFVQAMSELPVMIVGTYVLNKLKGKRMMIIGSLMLGLRFVLYAAFPTTRGIFVSSSLQMISFPFILISQKELFLRETPKSLTSTGQMVAIAFTAGLAAIIAPILAGYLSELMPIRTIIFGFGIFMLIPMTLMFFYKPKPLT